MKPSVEQEARPRPLLVMQCVTVTSDCIHKQMLRLFFFPLCFVLFYFCLSQQHSFWKVKKKTSGKDSSFHICRRHFYSFCQTQLVYKASLFLADCCRKQVHKRMRMQERMISIESVEQDMVHGASPERALFLAVWWKFTFILLLGVRQHAWLNNGARQPAVLINAFLKRVD